jgi:hypothetical protein
VWEPKGCVMNEKSVVCGEQEALFFLMVLYYDTNIKRSLKCCDEIVKKYNLKICK